MQKYSAPEGFNLLISQSNFRYQLLKEHTTKLYHVRDLKTKKTALIGDKDEAEDFILYGITDNEKELKTLNFK